MTDKTIELDERRGMAAQKETRLRRLHAEVREQRDALRARQMHWKSNSWRRPQRVGRRLPKRRATCSTSSQQARTPRTRAGRG